MPSQYTDTAGSAFEGFLLCTSSKNFTLVTKEVASVSCGEVPPSRDVKVLLLSPPAHQLCQILIVWVVVKGTDILTAADHVVHVWSVVDGGGIRQSPESRGLRRPGGCPLVSLNTGRLENERLVSKSSPSRTGGGTPGA